MTDLKSNIHAKQTAFLVDLQKVLADHDAELWVEQDFLMADVSSMRSRITIGTGFIDAGEIRKVNKLIGRG